MAQYDLLLTQNVHASGIEFSEKLVNIAKGGLLSAAAGGVPTVLAGGTDGYHLVRDDAEATGLKWVAITAGHAQGTDAGTTAPVFELDTDGFKIELTAESASKLGVKVDGGATYADFQAKDAMFAQASGTAAPTTGNHLTNKTYVDGILAANDAMIFKGTVGTGGTHEIAAFNSLSTYNAGWAYKVVSSGTIKGVACEINDMLVASVDRAGSGNLDADWVVIQTNIDGAVIGPASVTADYVALFSGTTGKVIKAGTGALGTAAYVATGTFATAAQGTLADGAVAKSLITAADQVVIGTASATPGVITAGASTIIGKKATGTLGAMSVAETLAVIGVAAGATANAKATSAEVNTGTDDAKFLTPLALSGSSMVKGPGAAVVDNVPVVWDSTSGKLIKSHASGALGTAAFVATGTFATAAKGTTADGAVPKSLYDANTILYATADNTPVALTVGPSTLVGRKASGDIVAMTPAEAINVLCVTAPASKTASGTSGQIAFDTNYAYRCTAANVWARWPIATNW
ncbi:MAG: hypothetical protein NTV01_00130 [Bacteroidia bacterium]|nr:hypothetical protein [Bacteroidia bacterium]